MDCLLPGSSVHEISQARMLEWVAVSSSGGSSRPRDRTWVSCIAGRFFFTIWATRTPRIGVGCQRNQPYKVRTLSPTPWHSSGEERGMGGESIIKGQQFNHSCLYNETWIKIHKLWFCRASGLVNTWRRGRVIWSEQLVSTDNNLDLWLESRGGGEGKLCGTEALTCGIRGYFQVDISELS